MCLIDLTKKIPMGRDEIEAGNIRNREVYRDDKTLIVRRVSSRNVPTGPYHPWWTEYRKRSIFGVSFWRLEKIHYQKPDCANA